jgi:hypothetical protein
LQSHHVNDATGSNFLKEPESLVFESMAGLRSLTGLPISELICLEICAGSARLSRALKDRGFSVFPIDHAHNRHKPMCRILQLDLLNRHHIDLLWGLLKEPMLVYVHLAPPCGTSSKARERPLKGAAFSPKPLRSAQHLMGLPSLSTIDADRVKAANKIYQLAVQVMIHCSKNGILASFENPRSAWTWPICELIAESTNCSTEWAALSDVEFQHCMYGGKRDKWSKWKCVGSFLNHLAVSCDGKHEHAPWGLVFDPITQTNSFATAQEAEYPLELCRQVADSVLRAALANGALANPTSLDAVHAEFSHDFNRIATFQQPRGNRYPQLLSEFKTVCYREEVDSSSKFRLLRFQRGEGGESSEVVGVLRSPAEFLQESLGLAHPADHFLCLPDVLKTALYEILTLGPLQITKQRLLAIRQLQQRAKDLEAEETKFHSSLPKHLQKVLRGKRLLLFKQLLEEAGYPDTSLADDIAKGFDVVGDTPRSGIFQRQLKPALTSVAELKGNSEVVRQSLASAKTNTDDEAIKAVWKQTLEEADSGWLVGPLYDTDQVTSLVGSPNWIPTRRFPLQQKNKVRVIDDCKESGINDALKTHEKLNLMDSDALATLLMHVSMAMADKQCSLDLSCGSSLSGRIHDDWYKPAEGIIWHGRALDLAHAYKQLGCSQGTMWASVVQTVDPTQGKIAYFVSSVLMFGATSSVYAFNRTARGLWYLMVRWLKVLALNFYDDYPTIEPKATGPAARAAMEAFLKILGWELASGAKSPPFQESFEALGISVSLRNLCAGSFQFSIKPSRVTELYDIAAAVVARGTMSRTEAQSLFGKLLFARGQMAGMTLKVILDSIQRHMESHGSGQLSSETILAMETLMELLLCHKPRVFSWSDPHQPIVIYTDGASEGDHMLPSSHTVGAVFVDPTRNLRLVLDGYVNDRLVKLWCLNVGDKFICQVEAYPILCIAEMYLQDIRHRRVLFFVDNDATRHAFIRCGSQSVSMQALAFCFHRLQHDCMAWFARVPTDSNPADLPSRGQALEAAALFGCRHVGPLSLSKSSIDFLESHTLNRKRKHASQQLGNQEG